jgi:MFS family permease
MTSLTSAYRPGAIAAGRVAAPPSAVTPSVPLSPVALAAALLGPLLAMIDFFIVNVALPSMATDLSASTSLLELVVSGYATAYAVLLVVGGRLGDAFGRRRLFVAGMAAFTVTSLLCGLAPTAPALVAARVLQGAAAALMVPQTLATIQATGTASSRSRAVGWFGATGGIAAVVGQVLGGVLVSADLDGSQWRPIFLVNVPIGLAGLWLARTRLPETRSPLPTRPDVAGTALLAAAVISVLVPLTEGRADGWPLWSLALLASAPAWGAAFVLVERRLERRLAPGAGAGGVTPLLPPSLLRHRSMRVGLALAAPFFAGFGTFMFVYALVVQSALGWSPAAAGLALTPMAVSFLTASLLTARAVARWGRGVVATGATLQAAGLVVLGATVWATWPSPTAAALAPGLAIAGFGQGWVMPSLIRIVLSEVPVASAGAGSGALATTQQLSLAVGVAAFGSLFVTLAAPGALGILTAFLIILGLQALVAVAIGLGSRALPVHS